MEAARWQPGEGGRWAVEAARWQPTKLMGSRQAPSGDGTGDMMAARAQPGQTGRGGDQT
mgnify:CR=1 FL=1